MKEQNYIILTLYRPTEEFSITNYISLIQKICNFTLLQAEQCAIIILLKGKYNVIYRAYTPEEILNANLRYETFKMLGFKAILEIVKQPSNNITQE